MAAIISCIALLIFSSSLGSASGVGSVVGVKAKEKKNENVIVMAIAVTLQVKCTNDIF